MRDSQKSIITNSILSTETQNKRDLYIKIYKQEFIRELEFIWDVVNGRAKAKDSFTTKIVALLKDNAPKIPLMGDAIDKLSKAIEFAANEVRDKEMGGLASIYQQLDLKRLEILVDVVAREAYRRYEFFIEQRLCDDPEDGVIPFAKVGVARSLEYLARKRSAVTPSGWMREKLKPLLGDSKDSKDSNSVELSESFLLAGLVEGRSGQFIQGWTNNKVKLNRKEQNFLKQSKTVEVDIEDAYARPALMWFEVKQGNLVRELYTRAVGRHQEGSALQKLQNFFKGETESLFNFGYVKNRKEKEFKADPLCGYAVMPLKVIADRYDYKPYTTTNAVSVDFKSEFQRQHLSVVQIDKETLKNYVVWYRQNSKQTKNSVADFLRLNQVWMGAKWVICQDDLTGVDLKGVNLSNMDLSGATLSGDLTGINFSNSYLIGTKFIKVVSAKQANFQKAQCAFMRAEGVDFTGSDFTQTNCSFAKLSGATLINCKLLGVEWHQTDLKNIKSDVDLLKEQQSQLKLITVEMQQQRVQMKEFSEILTAQTEKLNQLREQVNAKIQQTSPQNSADQEQLQTLNDQVQQLVKQREARALFEQYCRHDIKQLQKTIQQAASKEALDELKQQLQATQQQLKLVQLKNDQGTSQEFDKQLGALGSPYAALKQVLKKIQGDLYQELQELAKQQEERFNHLAVQIDQVEQQLTQRLEQLEKRVDNLEVWVNQAKKGFELVEQTVPEKLLQLKKRFLEDKDTLEDLANYIPARGAHRITDTNTFDMEKAVTDFFKTDKKVLLILGNSGGGKSTFNRFLGRRLWETYKIGDPIPLFVALPNLHNPEKTLLAEHLGRLGFTEKEIQHIQQNYPLHLILDGYDEISIGNQKNQFKNLYTANQMADWPGPGAKVVITCRTEHLTKVDRYERYFMPGRNEKLQPAAFLEMTVAPFNTQQITAYITKYLELHANNTLKDLASEWRQVETYLKHISNIPGMRELITTPFLLMIAMDVMPEIVEKYQHLDEAERLKLTGANLYDAFVKKWFERQADKLMVEGGLPEDGHDVTEDFMEFSKELAKAMHNAKTTRVYYKQQSNLFNQPGQKEASWSAQFFNDTNKDMQRARKGCPLKKVAPYTWAFIHASLMEYFVTKDMYDDLTGDGFSPSSDYSENDCNMKSPLSAATQEPVHSPQSTNSTLTFFTLTPTNTPRPTIPKRSNMPVNINSVKK